MWSQYTASASSILPTALLIILVSLSRTGVGALVLPSSEHPIAQLLHQRSQLLQWHITDDIPSPTDLMMSHQYPATNVIEGATTLTQAGIILPLVPDAFTLLAAAILGLVLFSELESIIKRVQARQDGIDRRVPYDAAAQLAYEKSDKNVGYDEFKAQFEADAIAEVIAKRKRSTSASKVKEKGIKVDNSFGFIGKIFTRDSRDKIAENRKPKVADKQVKQTPPPKSAKSIGIETKTRDAEYAIAKARALATAIVSDKWDVSTLKSDAAAQLAYASSDRNMNYNEFKLQYEAGALVDREAGTADVKVPYNAAARLAFELGGYAEAIDFPEFEKLYVKQAVAKAKAKKRERDTAAAVVKAQVEAACAAVELQSLRDAQQEVSEADAALRSLLKSGKKAG